MSSIGPISIERVNTIIPKKGLWQRKGHRGDDEYMAALGLHRASFRYDTEVIFKKLVAIFGMPNEDPESDAGLHHKFEYIFRLQGKYDVSLYESLGKLGLAKVGYKDNEGAHIRIAFFKRLRKKFIRIDPANVPVTEDKLGRFTVPRYDAFAAGLYKEEQFEI